MTFPNCTVVDHPLVKHKLTLMRKAGTSTASFRRLLSEISMLLAYEATRDMKLTDVAIETPLAKIEAPMLEGKKLVLVAILRAGLGILDGMLELIPSARVGHIGLYRDHATLESVEYFYKVPQDLSDREVIVCDPMLATGNSASAAVERLKRSKPASIKFVCLLACPEGLAKFYKHHPDVPVVTAAVDSHLNEVGYIVPGLGDAGDRLFGTKLIAPRAARPGRRCPGPRAGSRGRAAGPARWAPPPRSLPPPAPASGPEGGREGAPRCPGDPAAPPAPAGTRQRRRSRSPAGALPGHPRTGPPPGPAPPPAPPARPPPPRGVSRPDPGTARAWPPASPHPPRTSAPRAARRSPPRPRAAPRWRSSDARRPDLQAAAAPPP